MKLAEALILRADAQKRLAQLQGRLQRSAKVQEGEQPAEQPTTLLAELQRTLADLLSLIKRINRTNAATVVEKGKTLTDLLAERDVMALERNVLDTLIRDTATVDFRYSRAEIKTFIAFDVAALQKRIDDLARDYREADTRIQQLNWSVDLVE